jgi:DNA-directed RNA polymerase subunit RPC12/RpoP
MSKLNVTFRCIICEEPNTETPKEGRLECESCGRTKFKVEAEV